MCEEEQTGMHRFHVCCFAVCTQGLPLPHLPKQKPINRLEREYIYQSPSIINQCRVKSEYVSEQLNKVETRSGF